MEKERDQRLENDKDFVLSKKHGNSLKKLIDSYPQGVPESVICRILQMDTAEVRSSFAKAIDFIRKKINIGNT